MRSFDSLPLRTRSYRPTRSLFSVKRRHRERTFKNKITCNYITYSWTWYQFFLSCVNTDNDIALKFFYNYSMIFVLERERVRFCGWKYGIMNAYTWIYVCLCKNKAREKLCACTCMHVRYYVREKYIEEEENVMCFGTNNRNIPKRKNLFMILWGLMQLLLSQVKGSTNEIRELLFNSFFFY